MSPSSEDRRHAGVPVCPPDPAIPADPVAYRDALRESFPGYSNADGAMHAWRFNLFERLVAKHGLPPGANMLNVGCGPFAFEALSRTARRCKVTSFDYTAGFAPVFDRLNELHLLADVSFFVGDIREVTFPANSFDIIVFHDVFYEAALSAPDVVARYLPFLKPGGLAYFDIMDQRTARLWRLFGRERPEYRRYDVDAALRHVTEAGLKVLECCPTEENRIGAKRLLMKTIRILTGRINSFGVLARRSA